MLTFLFLFLFGLLVFTAVYDIQTLTIPNWIPIAVVLLFIPYFLFTSSTPTELAWHALSFAIAFVIGVVLFSFGVMGGGDIKLFSAVSLWVFPSEIIWLILLIGITGGIISILFVAVCVFAKVMSQSQGTASLPNMLARKIPYGPSIAFGSILMLWPKGLLY